MCNPPSHHQLLACRPYSHTAGMPFPPMFCLRIRAGAYIESTRWNGSVRLRQPLGCTQHFHRCVPGAIPPSMLESSHKTKSSRAGTAGWSNRYMHGWEVGKKKPYGRERWRPARLPCPHLSGENTTNLNSMLSLGLTGLLLLLSFGFDACGQSTKTSAINVVNIRARNGYYTVLLMRGDCHS
jgi:hypothetical protein